MDQMLVDVTDIPDAAAGDTAVLIGTSGSRQITACDLAEQTGTITNEILSRLGNRYPALSPPLPRSGTEAVHRSSCSRILSCCTCQPFLLSQFFLCPYALTPSSFYHNLQWLEPNFQDGGTQGAIRGVGVATHPGRCGVKYTPWPKRDLVKNYFQRGHTAAHRLSR